MTLNDRGGGHQRSFGRFLVCLFIWFIILTQCGTYWIYETIDKIVNIDNNNNNQEVTSSEKSINNEVQKPRNPSGIEKIFCLYRGSPPYAFFGTWKKPCYMKLVLVGLYCGPLLTLIPPLTRT